MLGSDPMAHVFATLHEEITFLAPTRTFAIEMAASAVEVSGTTMLVGMRVRPGSGSSLDPSAIAVTDAAGNAVSLEYVNSDADGSRISVALAKLTKGAKYNVTVGADRGSKGTFLLDAMLAGDLDGNRRVDTADSALMTATYGSSAELPAFIGEADANYDGRITAFDRSVQIQNLSDRALINPMTMSVRLDPPPSGYTSDGTPLTKDASTRVKGVTSPGAVVTIDMDGDGGAEYSAVASGDGSYVLSPAYEEGVNSLRVRATDAFGQYRSLLQRLAVDTVAPAEPVFALDPESDSAPLGDGVTTFRNVSLVGTTEPSARVELESHGLVTFADLSGNFQISGVVLAVGTNSLEVKSVDAAGNTAKFTRAIVRSSPADTAEMANAWTAAMLEAVRLAAATPPVASRAMAMVSIAMYDAVNSVNAASTAFLAKVGSPSGASAPAAGVAAAHAVLSHLFPAQRSIFNQLYTSSLGQIDPGQSRDDGLAVGAAVGEVIIALRLDDGSLDYVEYNPSNEVGLWRPTAPGYAVALLPNWVNVKPFAMTSGSQFRPDAPMALDSAQYAGEYEEIRAIGRADSSTRTPEQTQIARFWADGAGTYTPAGHWNAIAAQLAQAHSLTLFETLKLMAQLNVALADAAVVSWDAKYTYNQWRPITAIREGGTDGNAATTPDGTWLPLLVTPPFPDYLSGHSTFGGAAARILAEQFGDNTPFTTTSYGLPNVQRSFASLTQAAQEASVSRVYGGIHFRSSCAIGLETGRQLAEFVLTKFAETSDKVAPSVTLLTPKEGTAQRGNFQVTGRVVDGLSDIMAIEVRIDSDAPFMVEGNEDGEFAAVTALALDGSADGEHTISVRATDAVGNQSEWATVKVLLDTAAPGVEIASPAEGEVLDGFGELTGMALGTGSGISKLEYSLDGGASKPVQFDPATGEFDQELDLSDLLPGNHSVRVIATDKAGNTTVSLRGFVLPEPVALVVTGISPAEDSTDVGVTQRPRIMFSRAIDLATLSSTDFYILFGSVVVPSTVVPADDRMSAWLFPVGTMPAGSRLTVRVVGDGIAAPDGQLLDADGDQTPGGVLEYSFTTVSTSDVPGTKIFGVLADSGADLKPFTFDDQGAGPDQTLMTADDVYKLPIAHVEVYILGRESQKVYTDAQGRFTLDSVPVGNVKLVVNGRTATGTPNGIYFPEMVMDLTIRAGVTNVVMDAMRPTYPTTGITGVHLPRIRESILTDVSGTNATVIGVPDEAAPDLTPEQREELSITVQPGSLVGENGQKLESAKVGLSTVPAELVRDMLPPGLLQHTFDVTVQAPGVATFSTPLAFTAPNVFGGAPGTKLNFLSFDHTTGRLVIEGTGTVSEDGLSVTTDPGTGITKPGWHGWTPPGGPGGPPCKPAPTKTVEIPPIPFKEGIQDYYFVKDDGTFTLKFRNDAKMPDGATDPCHPLNHKSTSLVVEIKVEGKADDFLEGLKTQKIDLRPGAKEEVEVDVRDLLDEGNFLVDFFTDADVAKRISSRVFGVKVMVSGTQDGKGPKLFDETFYVYRLLDIADLEHVDSVIDFPKTYADGTGGIEQTVPFKFEGPATAQPVFTSADPQFRFGPADAVFDPHATGSRSSLVTIKTPDGKDNGTFTLRGLGVGTQSVHLNQSGMSNALAGLIDHAMPDIRFSWLAGIVPDGDGDGLRSDEPGFGTLVSTLYTAMKTNVASSFGMAGAGAPLRLDDTASGSGIAVTWRAESYKARTINQTVTTDIVGSTIDLNGYTGLVKFDVNVGAVDSLAFLTVRYEHSSDGATWSELGNSWVTNLSSNSKFSEEFASPKRYARARITTLGTGNGAFVIDATGYKGTTTDYAPAWAYWADFDRAAFEDLDAGDTPVTGKRFMMSTATNRSATDNGTDAIVTNLDILAQYVASSFDFGTLLGNAVTHEVGHDLGAIHFRSSSSGYIVGDVMGSDGSSSGAVVTFQKLAPIVKFALGVPVNLQETRSIFKYYDAMMPLEKYRFNSAGYRSGGNVRHGNGDEDTRIDGSVLRLISSPIEVGKSMPTEVTQIDLGAVIADGAGNESKSADVWLFNDGDEPLTIREINFGSLWGLTTTGYSGGDVVLQPFHAHDPNWQEASLRLTLTFDPATSGELEGRIAVKSDSVLSNVDEFSVSARAIAAGGELRVTTRSNLGAVVEGSQSQSAGDELVVTNHGSASVVVTSVMVSESASEFVVLGLPTSFPDTPIVLAPGESYSLGIKASPSALGLRRGEITIVSDDPQSPVTRTRFVATSWTPDKPNYTYGDDYVSMAPIALIPIPSNRLVSGPQGDWEVFLPPNRQFHFSIFDPASGLISHGYGVSATSGVRTELRTPVFEPSTASDSDSDGLPDDIESTIGTDITKPDTNANGLDDFSEIQLGLNPLDGTGFPTSVIASLKLMGEAKEVVVAASADGAASQTAFVAAGSGGLAVVDVSRFNKPVLLSQLALAGDAQDVAHDGDAKIVVVAAGSGGVHIVNVADPTTPQLVRTINAVSSQVELLDGVIFATVGGELRAYDVVTGERLSSIAPSGASFVSMTRSGRYLYTIDTDRVVRAVEIDGPAIIARGQVSAGVYGKLFAGGGVLYIASEGYTAGGFATVDIANPNSLKLLSGVDNASLAGRAMAATGSGLGVLVGRPQGGGFGNVLDLADIRDPANTGLGAGTRITLPALPYAVAISGGMAFIADGTSGLVVANYLAFDNLGVAPTVAVSAAGLDIDPGAPGVQVTEASVVTLGSSFGDDVQVHHVDLIVNGKTVRSDASYPFDLTLALPTIGDNGGTSVKVQVRATDSGGNSTLSPVVDLALRPDTTAPLMTSMDPPNNSSRGKYFRSVTLVFNEPIDASTVNAASIGLTGPNGPVVIEAVQSRAGGRNIQITFATLVVGTHDLVIRGSQIKDRAGNAVGGSDMLSKFEIREATAVWTNPAGGFWDIASNWDTNKVPGAGDDVLIDIAGGATITYRQGTTEVRSIASKNPFTISGGTLAVTQTIRVENTLSLAGGTLKDATVMAGGPGSSVWGDYGTVSGVTLEADLVVRNGKYLFVANGLKVNKTVSFETGGSSASLYFTTSQSITGSGQINVPVRTGIAYFYMYNSGLSVNIDVPVQAAGPLTVTGSTGTLTLQRPVGVVGTSFQTGTPTTVIAATLSAAQSTVRFGGPFSNLGQISLTSSALTLASTFTLEQLGTVTRASSDIFLTGTLDNTSRTLDLSSVVGSWFVTGTILKGLVTSLSPKFILPASWNVTLDGVTVATVLEAPSGSNLSLRGSWTNLGVLRPAGGIVTLDGAFTLETLGALQYQSGSVRLRGTLDLAGQTLVLDAVTGPWTMNGGTIRNGTLGSASLPLEVQSGLFDGMTVQRQVVVGSGYSLNVTNGLRLDAELLINGTAYFTGQTVTGDGSVRMGGTSSSLYTGYNSGGDRTLVLTPDIELRGVGQVRPYYNSKLVAQGQVRADSAGLLKVVTGTVLEAANVFVGNGAQLEADMAGTVGPILIGAAGSLVFTGGTYTVTQPVTIDDAAKFSLGGRWTNAAAITLASGELVLGGEFTKADLGVLNHVGGKVTFSGVLLNASNTVELDTLMSGWSVAGGTIRSGFVFTSGSSAFMLPWGWNLVLDGATLLSPVKVPLGTALAFNGAWVMSAETQLAGGTASLGGTFTPDSIALLTGDGSVRVTGTFLLGGATFDLTDRPDQWMLAGGLISTGILTGGPTANLTVETTGTLRAMTLGIATVLPKSKSLVVESGLRIDSTLAVLGTAYLTGQTITGDGQIVLGDAAGTGTVYTGYNSSGDRAVTFEQGIEIKGRGYVYNYNSAAVTVKSDIMLNGSDYMSFSAQSLTMMGKLDVRGGADLYLSGIPGVLGLLTVDGTGSTASVSGSNVRPTGGVAVTGGGVVTISNMGGQAGPLSVEGTSSRLTLNGSNYALGEATTVRSAATLELRGSWTNSSTLTADPGTTLSLGYAAADMWSNVGQIHAAGAAVWLRGTIGLASLGTVDFTGAAVALATTLNLGGGALTTGGAMGAWRLEGGTILNGTLQGEPAGVFVIKNGTLDTLTLAMETRSEGTVYLLNTVTLASATFRAVSGTMYFYSSGLNQLLGTGELVLGTATGSATAYLYQSNSTLRIGAGVTVRGNGSVYANSTTGSTLDLRGQVVADVPTRTLTVAQFATFLNTGEMSATGGGRLTVSGITGSLGVVKIDGAGSMLTASGSGYSNGGSIALNGGATATLNDRTGSLGVVTLSGASSLTVYGTGYFINEPLSTSGGTINLRGSWTNLSTVSVTNGQLQIGEAGKSWLNSGQINATVSSTVIDGVFAWSNLGAFNRTAGTVTLKGAIDNRDQTIVLQNTIGDWSVVGGRVWGGQVMGATFGYILPSGWDLTIDSAKIIRGLQIEDLTTLSLVGSWDNNSTLSLKGGTLNLGGTFARADLGTFVRTGGTVRLTGTLLNDASTLLLDAALGSWVLAGGTIDGGTVATAAGYELAIQNGTFAGVRLVSDITVTGGWSLDIAGWIDLAANIRLYGANGGGYLRVHGFGDLLGQGEIQIGDASGGGAIVFASNGEGPTIIGPDVVIRGRGSVYDSSSARITLLGTIVADVPSQLLSVVIDGGLSTSFGRIGVAGTSRLTVQGLQGQLGVVEPLNPGAVLSLLGSFSLNSDLVVPSGATLTLGGNFVNNAVVTATGATLTLGSSSTRWKNLGQVIATDSTITLEGTYSPASIGTIIRTASEMRLRGTLTTEPLYAPGASIVGSSSDWIGVMLGSGVPGAAGYVIERSLSSSSGFVEIARVAATEQEFYDKTVSPLVTYYYRVRSYNEYGVGTSFASVSATTKSISSSGLLMTTFQNLDATGTRYTTITPQVNFGWGTGNGPGYAGYDDWAAVFTGAIVAPETGEYTLYTLSDDGVRVYVDDVLVIDNYTSHPETEDTAVVTLIAGQRHRLRVEYFEAWLTATLRMSWSSATIAKTPIPQSNLAVPLASELAAAVDGPAVDPGSTHLAVGDGWVVETATVNSVMLDVAAGQLLRIKSVSLSNVTLQGDTAIEPGSSVYLYSNLVLNGTLAINAGSTQTTLYLGTSGHQSIAGSGTISLNGIGDNARVSWYDSTRTITIGGGITIQGSGLLGLSGTSNYTTLANDGVIAASGEGLSIRPAFLTNRATIQADAGSRVTVAGTITNTGVLHGNSGAVVELAGRFTVDSLGQVNADPGFVRFTGVLDNTGRVLMTDAVLGDWYLAGGRIFEGSMATTTGDAYTVPAGQHLAIEDADLLVDLFAEGATLTLIDAWATSTAVRVGDGGLLRLGGTVTLAQFNPIVRTGTGQVALTGTLDAGGGELALSEGRTGDLRLEGGTIRAAVVTSTDGRRLVLADGTVDAITMGVDARVVAGGNVQVTTSLSGAGTFSLEGGTLSLGIAVNMSFLSGRIQPGGWGRLVIKSALDLNGQVLDLDADAYVLELSGGANVRNGTLRSMSGEVVTVSAGSVALEAVVLDADVDVSEFSTVNVTGPLTVNRTVQMRGYGTLIFAAGGGISGDGSLITGWVDGTSWRYANIGTGSTDFNIGAGIEIYGGFYIYSSSAQAVVTLEGSATVASGAYGYISGMKEFRNHGTMTLQTGSTLQAYVTTFMHEGRLEVNAGADTYVSGIMTIGASAVTEVTISDGPPPSLYATSFGFGGMLRVRFAEGFAPKAGDRYGVFQYSSWTGSFGSVEVVDPPSGLAFSVDYGETEAAIVVGLGISTGSGFESLSEVDDSMENIEPDGGG